MRRAPIFFNLFQGNQAGHTAILGKTGYGKVRRTAA
jgi:type IV secretory pathway VirB4 component